MARLPREEEEVLIRLIREIDDVPHLQRGMGDLPDYFESSAYFRKLDPEMKRLLSVIANNIALEERIHELEQNRWPVKMIRLYNWILDKGVAGIIYVMKKRGKENSKYAHPVVLKAVVNKVIKIIGAMIGGAILAKLASIYWGTIYMIGALLIAGGIGWYLWRQDK